MGKHCPYGSPTNPGHSPTLLRHASPHMSAQPPRARAPPRRWTRCGWARAAGRARARRSTRGARTRRPRCTAACGTCWGAGCARTRRARRGTGCPVRACAHARSGSAHSLADNGSCEWVAQAAVRAQPGMPGQQRSTSCCSGWRCKHACHIIPGLVRVTVPAAACQAVTALHGSAELRGCRCEPPGVPAAACAVSSGRCVPTNRCACSNPRAAVANRQLSIGNTRSARTSRQMPRL